MHSIFSVQLTQERQKRSLHHPLVAYHLIQTIHLCGRGFFPQWSQSSSIVTCRLTQLKRIIWVRLCRHRTEKALHFVTRGNILPAGDRQAKDERKRSEEFYSLSFILKARELQKIFHKGRGRWKEREGDREVEKAPCCCRCLRLAALSSLLSSSAPDRYRERTVNARRMNEL